MELLENKFNEIMSSLAKEADTFGLQISPFRVGWYNDALKDKRFAFEDDPNTLGFVVISTPSMFEKTFLPYLNQETDPGENNFGIKDPLDRCMKETFHRLSKSYSDEYDIVHMHDFEISPINKRPKVLVQTAGHVSGAVRFYQKCDLDEETENDDTNNNESQNSFVNSIHSSKVFPVCLHPKFGGWFALRGILLFKNTRVGSSYLNPISPPTILKTKYEIANLLYLFNEHWRDSRYRDVGMPADIEKYSDLQQQYFGTEPSARTSLIERILTSK